MPKTTRDLIKRRHDQMQTHLDTVLRYLNELHDQMLEHHPDYSEGYANLILMVMQIKEFVDAMRGHI